MRKSRMVYVIAAAALCAMVVSCSKNKGSTSNPVNPPDQPLGNVILSEGFEGDSTYLDSNNYRQINYDPTQGMMSISTQHPHSGNGSLTSDSNNTSIKRVISPSIDDSIAGLQFYLMATTLAHTDFFAALCKPGSSADGLPTKYGMGIDKSDSLNYICYDYLNGINEYKNFALLTLNKWYKCKIEYDFSDTTLTYFLDDDTVYARTTPSTLTPFQTFVAIRDGLGAQGPSGYYIDDVTIYKR
jgi:hypothetical protein